MDATTYDIILMDVQMPEMDEAGMDDYIAKPMNIATLRSTLQKWAGII